MPARAAIAHQTALPPATAPWNTNKETASTQQETFIALAEDARQRLANREAIPAEEIVAWPLLDDLRTFLRVQRRWLLGQLSNLAAP